MLISTRIRGLICDATEVEVQLLTNREAVEMLSEQSYLDRNKNVPAEVFLIVRCCGNLPLCVCVVAGMIRANKDGSSALESIQEVLAMLQEDKAGLLSEEANFSVSDAIVGRSVRCLPSENARHLFRCLGACPEDIFVPIDFIAVLWAAVQSDKSRSSRRLKSAAKRLVSILALNNLLQEKGSCYLMHDIGNVLICVC